MVCGEVWCIFGGGGGRRFTNNLEARIRDVIVVVSGHFPGAADANDKGNAEERTVTGPSGT